MTEREWLNCTDPDAMRAFLRGRVSRRKLRLFACACCRSIWHLIQDDRSQRVVEVAERHAEGLASEGELEVARAGARAAAGQGRGESPGENRVAARAVWAAAEQAMKAPGLAARALGVMGAKSKPKIPDLISALRDHEAAVVGTACWALGHIGSELDAGDDAVSALIEVSKRANLDLSVKEQALAAVEIIKGRAKEKKDGKP